MTTLKDKMITRLNQADFNEDMILKMWAENLKRQRELRGTDQFEAHAVINSIIQDTLEQRFNYDEDMLDDAYATAYLT